MSTAALLALALAGALTGPAPPAPETRWQWPVGGGGRPALVAPFDAPTQPWGPGHRGIDLASDAGATVSAVADGVVSHRGRIAGRGTVSVTHRDGIRSTYEPVASDLAVGTRVRRGDVIGRVSTAGGHCRPRACLHVGAKRGPAYLDPAPFFGIQRVVLLPVE